MWLLINVQKLWNLLEAGKFLFMCLNSCHTFDYMSGRNSLQKTQSCSYVGSTYMKLNACFSLWPPCCQDLSLSYFLFVSSSVRISLSMSI